MSPHVSLPTASEIDFDITESISGNTCSGTSKGVDLPLGTKLSSLDVGTILDPSINIDGEDDETFIEAQRAALNRKASNIKGKANKKSSGFQSMGLFCLSIYIVNALTHQRSGCSSNESYH